MKLPVWFKVAWWALLSTTITIFLFGRHQDLVAGRAVPADVVVFLVWVALLLVPVFQEVELFGLKFRQEVEQLKEEIKSEIHLVRSELRNAIDIKTTFSPQITIPQPPPDWQLPQMEERIKAAVSAALAFNGIHQPAVAAADLAIDDDVQFLFSVRYSIERELRRIATERHLDVGTRRVAGTQLVRALFQAEVIEPSLANAIREVYAVASPAIHAEQVTRAQVSFVRDVGPTLVAALRALSGTVG